MTEECKTVYRFFRDTTRNVRASLGLPVDRKVDSDMETAWANASQNINEAMELGMGPNEEEHLMLWAKSSAQVYAGIMVDAVGQDYGPMVCEVGRGGKPQGSGADGAEKLEGGGEGCGQGGSTGPH